MHQPPSSSALHPGLSSFILSSLPSTPMVQPTPSHSEPQRPCHHIFLARTLLHSLRRHILCCSFSSPSGDECLHTCLRNSSQRGCCPHVLTTQPSRLDVHFRLQETVASAIQTFTPSRTQLQSHDGSRVGVWAPRCYQGFGLCPSFSSSICFVSVTEWLLQP